MKFVHLTPRKALPRVRRNGIRQGYGWTKGRGVYAVPLTYLPFIRTKLDRPEVSGLKSSVDLWKYLGRDRDQQLAAIVFRTTSDHWPADLYVTVRGTAWLTEVDPKLVTVADDDLAFVQGAFKEWEGCGADLKLSVWSPSGVGAVLRALRSHGWTTVQPGSDDLQIVFRAPIPARLIERVVPLYRPSGRFKQARERKALSD